MVHLKGSSTGKPHQLRIHARRDSATEESAFGQKARLISKRWTSIASVPAATSCWIINSQFPLVYILSSEPHTEVPRTYQKRHLKLWRLALKDPKAAALSFSRFLAILTCCPSFHTLQPAQMWRLDSLTWGTSVLVLEQLPAKLLTACGSYLWGVPFREHFNGIVKFLWAHGPNQALRSKLEVFGAPWGKSKSPKSQCWALRPYSPLPSMGSSGTCRKSFFQWDCL